MWIQGLKALTTSLHCTTSYVKLTFSHARYQPNHILLNISECIEVDDLIENTHKHPLGQNATLHQVTIMLSTSKNDLFPGLNQLLTTGADDPFQLSPERQRHFWKRTFSEVASMVTWWTFLRTDPVKMICTNGRVQMRARVLIAA